MREEQLNFRTITSEDGAAILNVQRGTIVTLNPSGAMIWAALQSGKTLDAIKQELSQATGLPLPEIEVDVECFASSLLEQGISY